MIPFPLLLGTIVILFGISFYIRDTLKGKTKPNKVSWLLWAIAPLIAATAGYVDGLGWAAFPIFISGFASLLIFITSFQNPKAYWKLKKYDYFLGLCSILSLILWYITAQPLVAILFALTSDAFASIPTIIKSWKHPETESGGLYVAALFNASMTFFALEKFNTAELAFPFYLVALNITLILAVYRKKIKRHFIN